MREAHLLDEIRLRPNRPRRAPRPLLIAATVAAAAVAAAPTLALSTSVRQFVGLETSTVPPKLLADKLVVGMTKQQVRRRIGPPTRIVGTCWLYREHAEAGQGYVLNAEKLCFLGDAYVYGWAEFDGRWDYPGTAPAVPTTTSSP